MDKPEISIVLTTYNRSHYLKGAIESILNQSYSKFKLIILDNGSDDDTKTIISTFNDIRINYIRSNINSKDFINQAFTFTQYKYFMITHDDDIMMEDFLKRSINFLDNNSNYSLVASSIRLMNADGKILNKIRPRLLHNKSWDQFDFIKNYMLRGDIIPCPTIVFRSEIIKENNLKYHWEVGPAVDLHLLFKINTLKTKIYLFKDAQYNYRIHKNQDSNQNRLSLEFQVRPYIISLLDKADLPKLSKKYKMASLGIILHICIHNFILGELSFKNFKKEMKRLHKENIKFNFYSAYWGIIGITRGLKNKLN